MEDDDDYDVLEDGAVVGRILKVMRRLKVRLDVDAGLWSP
jgi:hypothetical protein